MAFVKISRGRNEFLQHTSDISATRIAFAVGSHTIQKSHELVSVHEEAATRGFVENSDNTMMGFYCAAPTKFFEYCAAADVGFKLVFYAAVALAGENPIGNVALFDQNGVRQKEGRAIPATSHEQVAKPTLEQPAEKDRSYIKHGSQKSGVAESLAMAAESGEEGYNFMAGLRMDLCKSW
jgi:hypothetical protein